MPSIAEFDGARISMYFASATRRLKKRKYQ